MAKINPPKLTLPKATGTGASIVRAGTTIKRVEGANYNGQTPTNIRAGAKIASAGNKSKPYVFKPSDTPSVSGTKAYKSSSVDSLKKAQKRVKRSY